MSYDKNDEIEKNFTESTLARLDNHSAAEDFSERGARLNPLQMALHHADQIENMLIESGGELTPEMESLLSLNPKTISEIVDIKYMSLERMEASVEMFKKKAEQFEKIAISLDQARKYINESIKQYMVESGKKELKGNDYQFKLSGAAPKVQIVDESKLDSCYKKEKVEIQIDKKRIAEDLKKGIPVEGAILEESYSLRKSLTKGK